MGTAFDGGGGWRWTAPGSHWPRLTFSLWTQVSAHLRCVISRHFRLRHFWLRHFPYPGHSRPPVSQRHPRNVTHYNVIFLLVPCDVIPLSMISLPVTSFPSPCDVTSPFPADSPAPRVPPSYSSSPLGAAELESPLLSYYISSLEFSIEIS